jgi:hypothetical protein
VEGAGKLVGNPSLRRHVSRYSLSIYEVSSMSPEKSLSIPPVAQGDKASFEVLRVWIAEQSQHVSIRSGAWEDPFAWGIVLADLARHVALAHEMQDERVDKDAFLERLLEGFNAEIDSPTDEPEGEVTH